MQWLIPPGIPTKFSSDILTIKEWTSNKIRNTALGDHFYRYSYNRSAMQLQVSLF